MNPGTSVLEASQSHKSSLDSGQHVDACVCDCECALACMHAHASKQASQVSQCEATRRFAPSGDYVLRKLSANSISGHDDPLTRPND